MNVKTIGSILMILYGLLLVGSVVWSVMTMSAPLMFFVVGLLAGGFTAAFGVALVAKHVLNQDEDWRVSRGPVG